MSGEPCHVCGAPERPPCPSCHCYADTVCYCARGCELHAGMPDPIGDGIRARKRAEVVS